jgi:DNA processing protein
MMKNEDDILSWLALATVPEIGPARYRMLLKHFESPERILEAGRSEIEALPGLGPKIAESIRKGADYNEAEKQVRLLENGNYSLLTFNSSDYPEKLKNIYDPPPFLFYEGDIECLSAPTIAIVGSRNLSVYGKMMAEKLSRELAEVGFTTVSGFARGIDTIAHKNTIESNGKTAAIFGCGLNICYPPENKALYRDLVLNGCAISEFFLGYHPEPKNFPRRNRIISGLSLGVLVIEAGLKSGALLTAHHALDQGREVYAVPGNINSKTSIGTNSIIKEGAKLVTSSEDILEDLKFLVSPRKTEYQAQVEIRLGGDHKKVFDILGDQPMQIDNIIKNAALPVSHALEILLELELDGLVRQVSGKKFVKQF